jgi:hypothetical protein
VGGGLKVGRKSEKTEARWREEQTVRIIMEQDVWK